MQTESPLRDADSVDEGADTAIPGRNTVVTIEARTGWWPSLRLRELWAYRELIYFMVWRDLKVRYKQTVLGASWAVVQPLFMMVVFTLVFGRLADVPSDGLPYPLFSFAALVPWTFFAQGFTQCAESLVTNARLITKIYFPRLVLPISAIMSNLVDFAIAFVVLLGLMLIYGVLPPLQALLLPAFLLLAILTALGIGLWLAALNAKYRDIRYTIPFIVQAWLFLTPVAYPSTLLDQPWRTVYALNPMVGVVDGFRWALLGADTAPGPVVLVSALVVFTLLFGGMIYFRRMESSFADVI